MNKNQHHRDKNKKTAAENKRIVLSGQYTIGDKTVKLRHSLEEHQSVIVLDPLRVEQITDELRKQKFLLGSDQESNPKSLYDDCVIKVIDADSFRYPNALVMNFANAKYPGGGYRSGAHAQEECLCLQSTLYASLSSKRAGEMYEHNMAINDPFDSDYMLISPVVEVFRNSDESLKEDPFTTAVITLPAPNRNGRARYKSDGEIRALFEHRIRNMLYCAAFHNYETITLGAWGCGSFGNDPRTVAEAFRKVLVDENLRRFFKRIDFAIPRGSGNDNYKVFRDVLEN